MEWEENGMMSVESLLFYSRLEQLAHLNRGVDAHNDDIHELTVQVGDIVSHCGTAISVKRSLLVQEANLTTSITDFHQERGKQIRKGTDGPTDMIHYIDNGQKCAIEVVRVRAAESINSDVMIETEGQQVRGELKTAATATPKERISGMFFDKDLAHLTDGSSSTLREITGGLPASERGADFVILASDLIVAQGSAPLESWLGMKIPSEVGSKEKFTLGVIEITMEVFAYAPHEVLQMTYATGVTALSDSFIVIAVTPAKQLHAGF